jgi:P pilus assembly chaperone PapD
MITLRSLTASLAALAAVWCPAAQAQIVVHPVIIDLPPDGLQRNDFEVANTSSERVFVAVEPARIDQPGSPEEARITDPDPEALGLLVSPPRLVIEPGERRFVRVAALEPAGDEERIFRVAVKPVVGEVSGQQSGLKVLVGFDLLVIQRPAAPTVTLDWEDRGNTLVVRNTGNSNLQLINGQACAENQSGDACTALAATRMYAGNEITIAKQPEQIATYDILFMGKTQQQVFKR